MKKTFLVFALFSVIMLSVLVYADGIPTQQQPTPNMGVQIAKGRNLVPGSYFFWGSSGDVNRCADNFMYGYFYDPVQKEYFGGALQKMNRGSAPPGSTGTEPSIFEFTDSALNTRYSQVFDGKLLGLDVLWVYSSADCSLDTGRELVRWSTSQKQFSDSQLQDISNIQLFQGWNFFYIPDSWKDGDAIKDYLGNCNVTRVAMWDGHSQEWVREVNRMSTSDILTKFVISPQVRAASLPVLLNVGQSCNLGYVKYGGNPSSPPGLPDNGNGNPTPTASCTDSDNGANYFVKGTTRGLNSFGEGSTAADYCVYAGQQGTYGQYLQPGQTAVMEYVCGGNGAMNDDLHVCDGGCQDGACI